MVVHFPLHLRSGRISWDKKPAVLSEIGLDWSWKKPRVFTAVSHDVKALQMPYCWLWHDGKRGFLIYSLDDFLRKLKAIGFPCLCPLDFFKQKIQSTECLHARLKGLKGPHSNRWRKFGSQISDFWTDAATVVGRVREEGARRKKIKVWRVKEKRDREREREREGERGREGERERERERETQSLNHFSVHQWVLSAIHASPQLTFPVGFLLLKLPPPPCAVLLV